jgi:oxygen-dependent protoporphyrinogen oxidase
VNPTFCILGGGISGLLAAYRIRALAGPGARIVVLDPADRLGGVLRTEHIGGRPFDIGAEAFIARRPEVPALLAELGLSGRLIGTTGVRPTIYSRARLHPLPPNAVNGIPSSADSVRGLVDQDTVARIETESDRPWRWQPGADPAVGAVGAEGVGGQGVTRSVDPMLSGVYAGPASGIGIRSAAPPVAAALDAGACNLTEAVRRTVPATSGGPVFGAIDGGYRVLLDALISRSGLRWEQAAAIALQPDGRNWTVTDGDGRSHTADGVVVALPAPRAAELLSAVAPGAAAAAAQIPVASAAVLALAVAPGTPFPPQSGVLVASGEDLHCKAITLSSRKWGAAGSAELLRMSFGRFGDDIARGAAEAELQQWAIEDLARVFGISVDPVEVKVRRWLDALPQYAPGHAQVAARVRADLPPTLAVAGNYLDGVGVPACLAVAGQAAESVVGAVADAR